MTSVNNLAMGLKIQEKYKVVEELHRRVLHAREKSLGNGHLGTLDIVDSLGAVLYNQGHFEAAEMSHRRALSGCEKYLGK